MGRQGTAWISSLLLHAFLLGGIFLLSQVIQQPLHIELVDFKILKSMISVDETLNAPPPVLPVPPSLPQPPQAKIKTVRPRPVTPVAPTPPPVDEILTVEAVAIEPAPPAPSVPVTAAEPAIPLSETVSSAAPSPPVAAGKASVPKLSPSQRYLQARFGYIRKQVLKKLIYPPRARRVGWEGQVKVKFVVSTSGKVEELEVLASSGYPLLDRQALNAVKQAAPFPPPPVAAEISLPITFRLE